MAGVDPPTTGLVAGGDADSPGRGDGRRQQGVAFASTVLLKSVVQ